MHRIGVFCRLAALAVLVLSGSPAPAQQREDPPVDASVRVGFVHLAQGVPGAFYEPVTPGPKAQVAVFIMHSAGDYLSHSGCTELSKRGYRVLCANNATGKSGVSNDGVIDRVMLDAKAGIAWLHRQPGVRKIVLMGHSGGGTVMTAYQLIAEGGVKACQGPEKIWKCPDSLAGMPPADGVMLIDSNWGLAEMTLLSIDPAVADESDGTKLDAALDMFNPANGFKPAGSTYAPAFRARFLTAEGRRMNALIAMAGERLAAIQAGRGRFTDDEPFVVPGATLLANSNRLLSQDVTLLARSRRPWPLVHSDGSVTTGIIRSVRVPENTRNPTGSMMAGALKTTVRNFLSTYAVRTTPTYGYDADSLDGVEWTSSYASPPGNVSGITVPLLTLGMTGHWEALAAEDIYDRARSTDKTIAFIEGADHSYRTCTKCERTPGEFGDTQKTTYDFIDRWIAKPGRFIVGS